jgi:hypothetical protein
MRYLNSSSCQEIVLEGDITLLKKSKNLHTSLAAAVAHLAEGLCFNALLTLKAENSLIRLVGTRIPTVAKTQ